MKLKNYFLLIIIPILFSGCGSYKTYRGVYQLGLQEVERPSDAKERYGESTIVNFEEDGDVKYRYEDDMIEIVWLPLPSEFAFELNNKTDHSIKIIWDEAVFVDSDGTSGKVMHTGVKFTDRNNTQPPSVVVKKAKLSDIVVPTKNVYYSTYSSGWNQSNIFKSFASTTEELEVIAKENTGKEVRILLPLEIQNTVNEYIFTFKVDGFTPED